MLEIRYKNKVKQLCDDQHHDGNAHRSFNVLAGIKAWRQHLDGHQADQPRAIAHQRSGGLRHVPVGKRAVVVERSHQRLGKCQKRHGTGQAQQQHNAQAPIEHVGILFRIVGGFRCSQLGHQHHANCHAQHGGGELHQAVGICQPAHAAGCEVRGNLRVDQQRNLCHADAQQRGQH